MVSTLKVILKLELVKAPKVIWPWNTLRLLRTIQNTPELLGGSICSRVQVPLLPS